MTETNTTSAFTRFITVSVIVLLATTLGVADVPDGALDLTFGVGGRVTMELSDSPAVAFAHASAIEPDGKIIAAGAVQPSGLDSSFRLDGRIVAAGTAYVSDYRRPPGYGLVARYNTDGSLDTTFGERGKVMTDALDTLDIFAVAVQPDGKIIAAGGSQSTESSVDFGLVRHNDDGSLDITFKKMIGS